jgi:hypothetical protein
VWLTSLFETSGRFSRLNLNTDGCGVSFGLLQWSQRAGRLHELFAACSIRETEEWRRIMGAGASDLLEYTAKPNGGVDAHGAAVNPAFELTREPWKSRLQALGASAAIQRVQLNLAQQSYENLLRQLRRELPVAASERLVAFLLDLMNQFGPSRVLQFYRTVSDASDAMLRMEEHFTALANPGFEAQVRARRAFFRTTPLLSDARFAG